MPDFERDEAKRLEAVAYRWAPIHYQHVHLRKPRTDLLCAVNFDGDWDTSNNRQRLDQFEPDQLRPVVYYSVAETSSYYHILYAFYHADDRDHDNDLEGCLLIVKKGGEGEPLAMITVAHLDFWSYAEETHLDRLRAGDETIDGKLRTEEFQGKLHPTTKQTAKKHACYAWKGTPWWETLGLAPPKKTPLWERILSGRNILFNPFGRRDVEKATGIKYVPGTQPRAPRLAGKVTFENTSATYVLVNLLGDEGLWKQRRNRDTFQENGKWKDGVFNGKSDSKAHAPWLWDDWNHTLGTNELKGSLFFEPAKIVRKYFRGFDPEPKDDYTEYWERVRRERSLID